jgi:hypothetical protein
VQVAGSRYLKIMNRPRDREVSELCLAAWKNLVGLDARPGDAASVPPAAVVSGCVVVSGAWEGTVVLECDERLARRACARMLGTPEENASRQDMKDVIGELSNIVAGGIRLQLPGPNEMSRPAVRCSPRALHTGFGGNPMARAALLSGDLSLRVSVVGSVQDRESTGKFV